MKGSDIRELLNAHQNRLKAARKALKLYVISAIAGLTGYVLVIWYLGWIPFIGVFLILWSKNLDSLAEKHKSESEP